MRTEDLFALAFMVVILILLELSSDRFIFGWVPDSLARSLAKMGEAGDLESFAGLRSGEGLVTSEAGILPSQCGV